MLSIINKRSNIFLLLLPTRVRFLVLTPPQSPLQGENFDQFVNWQSSWQGIWHICVKGGNGPEYLRHSLMSACPPSCLRQVIAGSKKRWSLIYLFFFFLWMSVFTQVKSTIFYQKITLKAQNTYTTTWYFLPVLPWMNIFVISHLIFCLK